LTKLFSFVIIRLNFHYKERQVYCKKLKKINWEKLQSYSAGVFGEFEGKLEDSIKKEMEDRARKIEEKRNKQKRRRGNNKKKQG